MFDPRGASARLERIPIRHDDAYNANAARLAVAASLGLDYEHRLWTIWSRSDLILGGDGQAR